MPLKLKQLDFRFENSVVKVVANRNFPRLELAGFSVGPLEEGTEYDVYYWVGKELAQEGIVHFREEDTLDSAKLNKVQWKERIQVAAKISEVSPDFYPQIRRYLLNAKEEITKRPEPIKVQEYERAKHLAHDIINARLKKIVTLAAGPTPQDQSTSKLTTEEKILHRQLSKLINEWRSNILTYKKETHKQ
ncbi:MAG: DNA replication complex GINS family protein [Candidatus Bathyarchaeota archaeon]|nr:DNA replication complex GINS family protein [Candidatus Bathyarchaeota archaeon]